MYRWKTWHSFNTLFFSYYLLFSSSSSSSSVKDLSISTTTGPNHRLNPACDPSRWPYRGSGTAFIISFNHFLYNSLAFSIFVTSFLHLLQLSISTHFTQTPTHIRPLCLSRTVRAYTPVENDPNGPHKPKNPPFVARHRHH